jgi:hypothetical protein
VNTGAAGGVVSLIIVTAVDPEEILPTASTASAVKVFVHSANETRIQKVPFDHQVATRVAPL